jgi:hypothetical protein
LFVWAAARLLAGSLALLVLGWLGSVSLAVVVFPPRWISRAPVDRGSGKRVCCVVLPSIDARTDAGIWLSF